MINVFPDPVTVIKFQFSTIIRKAVPNFIYEKIVDLNF